jgi:hypothetical protein
MKSLKNNEKHLNLITNWFVNRVRSNVAFESSSQERPIYLEAHGCYDMGHDCDTASVSG